MHMHLMLMYRHDLIDDADLERFSDELRDRMLVWLEEDNNNDA